MFNLFKNEENKNEVEKLDSNIQERLIEALLLIMYADKKITETEQTNLVETLDSISWKDDVRFKKNYGELFSKVREALVEENKLNEIIESIKALDSETNKMVIKFCEKMAVVDGKYDQVEKDLIDRMKK